MDDITGTSMQEQIPMPSVGMRVRWPFFAVRITYGLIVVNVLIFLIDTALSRTLLLLGGIIPKLMVTDAQYWRVLTAGFLHFNVSHIAFNMWALYVLGSEAEKLYGGLRFTLGYGIALGVAGLVMTAFQPLQSIGVGASGGVLGIAGLLIVYFYRYRKQFDTQEALVSLGRMVFINLAIGLFPGISLWGHLGGVIGGFVAGIVLCPRYEMPLWPDGNEFQVRMASLSGIQRMLLVTLAMAFVGFLWFIVMIRR